MSSPQKIDVFNKNDKGTIRTYLYPPKAPGSETIILLHGGPGVPLPMAEVSSILNDTFQVIYFEQRGTGSSINPSRDYSMEAHISDIDAIAEHFRLEKFHIFGHSWGGLYCQIYADAHPERLHSIFLCSPSSGTNSVWKVVEKEVLAYNQQNSSSWDFLMMGWYSLRGMLGSDRAYQNLFQIVMKAYHINHLPADEMVIDSKAFGAIKADPINLTRPEIQKYKFLPIMENPPFPIMLIYGDSDIYGASKELCIARYPSATLEIVEKCGHIPWIHQPDRFSTILKIFYSL